jgi:hypothetical protein
LYASIGIIKVTESRRIRWAGHTARIVEKGKSEWKRQLGRPRRRWLGIDLTDTGRENYGINLFGSG